ncbi:MAG TPA: glycosyltransferase [Stellaceae bacterium]|nr:glycosyltransferase [Stellaceae bacterium]
MSRYPPVSIIINTDGRAAILGNTIESLRYLRYPNLELVVVPGPTADGTRELLDRHWRGEIKIGSCPARNIAQSRNIGIALASGEIIAFLDDDEIPEPEWLEDLVPILEDPRVAVAGGWLVDHTGKDYQARFETVDRLGNVRGDWERAAPEFNFPLSFNVPHAMINSAFRRSALVDVGGFDEEFEYLLDETDLMVRFVDRGWHVVQTDRGLVHHKYLPSAVRNQQRVLTSWYSVVKNKAYFALLHGRRFAAIDRILADIATFVANNRNDVRSSIYNGFLPPEAGAQFEREAEEALCDGIARALCGVRRLGDPRRLRGDPAGFLPFHTRLPSARQRCFVLLSSEYPPEPVGGGSGCRVHDLARAVAARGHQVHLLTRGAGHDRVDFENGVWVHRLVVRQFTAPVDSSIPANVWNGSMTMLAEAEEIAKRRPIAAIHAPLGNAAAIAFLRDRKWPLVTSLGEHDQEHRADAAPIRAAKRRMLIASDGIIAPSAAMAGTIAAQYEAKLDCDRLAIVPDDMTAQAVEFLVRVAARREDSPAIEQTAAAL